MDTLVSITVLNVHLDPEVGPLVAQNLATVRLEGPPSEDPHIRHVPDTQVQGHDHVQGHPVMGLMQAQGQAVPQVLVPAPPVIQGHHHGQGHGLLCQGHGSGNIILDKRGRGGPVNKGLPDPQILTDQGHDQVLRDTEAEAEAVVTLSSERLSKNEACPRRGGGSKERRKEKKKRKDK